MTRRHESPVRRVNPSGRVVWVARYTDAEGNKRSAGTFAKKGEAQDAINAAYSTPLTMDTTVGEYAATWTTRHPRSPRTNATNDHRIGRLLDVTVEGRKLRDWPMKALRRKHVLVLVDAMLRRAA